MKLRSLFITATVFIAFNANAQSTQNATEAFEHWHLQDLKNDKVAGISENEALAQLEGRKTKTVIVAIIDSGIDTAHVDLKENLWVNPNEIPGNGIDDDQNGFIDDIHGWSFLGGTDGNVNEETLEITRLYRLYKEQVAQKELKRGDANWEEYQIIKPDFEKQYDEASAELKRLNQFRDYYLVQDRVLNNYFEKGDYTAEEVNAIRSSDKNITDAADFMSQMFTNDLNLKDLGDYIEHLNEKVKYHFNIDFNPRTIVGDDPLDYNDSIYGSNDLMAVDPDHGTHVAGIVGAVRNNGIGMDGISPDVKLMIIRVVPNGDERDKDVANAIKYAVRNGADVINMSFGKSYSPQSVWVADAIAFAEKHQVIMVHAAGNDGSNIDEVSNFPRHSFTNSNTENLYWIEVGALSPKPKKEMIAEFSNYGKGNIDIFAPGVDIYSTTPGDKYAKHNGTSMSAPVVTGVVAFILNYFPDIDRAQIKQLIVNSGLNYAKTKVYIPSDDEGKPKKTRLINISNSGKVINLSNAVEEMLKDEE